MFRTACLLIVLAAAAAAGCGESKEEKIKRLGDKTFATLPQPEASKPKQ